MTNETLQKNEVCTGRTHVQINESRVVGEPSLPATRQHGALLGVTLLGFALAFAGCVTSPFLSEDAAERLAAVDALTEQRKLAEVALDYCTEPYQELPSGCQMDVRIRAVERLTDRDLLMAVASFSIVKTAIKGKSCCVSLGEANAKLKELALDKLTEGKYIPSVLAAKEAFAIQPLFTKALFGYYQIAGNPPATAESAWLEKAKGKEASVAKSFCSCLSEGVPVELCKRVYGLLPASLSAETQKLVADSYKRLVTSASGVPDAVRALQLAEVVPASAVVKGDIDAMCKSVCSKVSSVGEFKAFGTLVNGVAKQYVSDAEGMIKSAATQVVQKLNGMQELADFASVLKPYTSPWVGQIGIEEQVRKCAMSVNNIGGIRTFASQLAFFNEVMLPNKTDIAGDAVIAVLNAVVEGKAVATASAEPAQPEEQSVKGRKRGRTNRTSSTQPGQKETIKDFVVAAAELPADILSDKAIVAIFKNKGVADAYSRALRTDGYREEMGNELAGAAMRSGSFGDLLAAGMIMGAMGDKESPTYTKMFSHLISIIRSGETFVEAAGFAKIYYPRNMLIEAADRRMDELTVAKCLVAVFENFPDSSWCIDKTLAIGMKFASAKKEDALAILQPVFEAYSKNRDKNIRIQAVACFNEPSKIEAFLSNVQFEDLGSDKFRVAYLAALARAVALFKAKGSETDGEALLNRLSVRIAEGVTKACEFLRKPDFAFPKEVAPFMESVGKCYPQLWAQIMMRATLPPCSAEFNKVADTLSSVPNLLSTFLAGYQCEPYAYSTGTHHFYYGDKIGKGEEPQYYYDSEWYWQALCVASEMEQSADVRAKLNVKMKQFAQVGKDLVARKKVYEAIKGGADKKEVLEAWAKVDADIPKNATALFNFSLDESISKMKREKVWADKYARNRIRLRGKLLDVKGSEVILDGGDDITDMTFANTMPSANADPSLHRKIEMAEDDVKRAKAQYESWKSGALAEDAKKELDEKEKILAKLLGKDKGGRLKVILKYTIDMSKESCDQISELNKGDVIIFEGFANPVYPRSTTTDLDNGTRSFSCWVKNGLFIKKQ